MSNAVALYYRRRNRTALDARLFNGHTSATCCIIFFTFSSFRAQTPTRCSCLDVPKSLLNAPVLLSVPEYKSIGSVVAAVYFTEADFSFTHLPHHINGIVRNQ